MNNLQTYNETPLIGEGAWGMIFAISDYYVVKMPRTTIQDLKNEIKISEELYEIGLNVPKPEGIQKVNIKTKNLEEKVWIKDKKEGFVMQRIYGLSGDDVWDAQVSGLISNGWTGKIERMYNRELRKARKNGFIHNDTGFNNLIYNAIENKVYLIDFMFWKNHPN